MKIKILMKKVECKEDRHSAASAYINEAFETGRRNGLWDRMLLALTEYGAKLYIAPHQRGIAVWLTCKGPVVPPEELVHELQDQIHRRHQTPKTSRQASVGKGKRVKEYRKARHIIG